VRTNIRQSIRDLVALPRQLAELRCLQMADARFLVDEIRRLSAERDKVVWCNAFAFAQQEDGGQTCLSANGCWLADCESGSVVVPVHQKLRLGTIAAYGPCVVSQVLVGHFVHFQGELPVVVLSDVRAEPSVNVTFRITRYDQATR